MTLNATKRDSSNNLYTLRTQGLLPAVVCGAGVESTSLSVDHATFIKLYKNAGETTVIDLVIEGGKTIQALISSVQIDASSHRALHVDFLAVDAKSLVTVSVPVELTGESPAVRGGLGILNVIMDEIEIEVLPTEIPKHITIDVSKLVETHDVVRISDLKLPNSAKPTEDSDAIVCVISEFKEETETEERTLDSIEVAKKGKKEVVED